MDEISEAEDTHLLYEDNYKDTEDTGTVTQKRGADYETAISRTGYGRFHYTLLLLCGWALSSDAIEVLSISFVLPAATCELKLSSQDKGWLTAVIFVGMMVGGYVWGVLADKFGRRAVLLYSLTINGIGGLCSSFAQGFPLFLFFRFVSGIGVGGSMPVVFAYYTEFQPKEKRGSMISMLATFWMSGSIVAAGLAWLIIPHTSWGVTDVSGFSYNSWRIFLAVCTLPCFTSAICFAFSYESPRFLMQTGDEQRALMVLRRIFKKNNPDKNVENDFQIDELQYVSEHRGDQHGGCCQITMSALKKFMTSTAQLFKQPLTKISMVLTVIYFTLSFGYYGMFMWFPELFARIEKYGGSPCSLHAVNETVENSTCVVDTSDTIYFESFLTAASNLPGNIFTVLIIDKVERTYLLCGSMMVSGAGVFLIAALQNKTQSLIMSCVFSAVSVIGWNCLDVIGMELFPTHLRSTANGVLMGAGRVGAILGNLVFGELVDVYCVVPMIMVAVLLAIGSLSALLLPSTTRVDLQ